MLIIETHSGSTMLASIICILIFNLQTSVHAVTYSGNATWYDSGLVTACGNLYSSSDLLVAVSSKYWGFTNDSNVNHDPECKKRILVTDAHNISNKAVIDVKDKCGGCDAEDIDLSKVAFQLFHPLSQGLFEVQWEFLEDVNEAPTAKRIIQNPINNNHLLR